MGVSFPFFSRKFFDREKVMPSFSEAGSFLVVWILLFLVLWVWLFTFNPRFVQVILEEDIFVAPGTPPDPVKCLIISLILGLVGAIMWWWFWKIF